MATDPAVPAAPRSAAGAVAAEASAADAAVCCRERVAEAEAAARLEQQVLSRLLYKNRNQHRRAVYFQAVCQVHRCVDLLLSSAVRPSELDVFRFLLMLPLPITAQRPLKKNLEVGSKEAGTASGAVLRKASVWLWHESPPLQDLDMCVTRAARLLCGLISSGFFLPLAVTLLSVIARLRALMLQIAEDVHFAATLMDSAMRSQQLLSDATRVDGTSDGPTVGRDEGLASVAPALSADRPTALAAGSAAGAAAGTAAAAAVAAAAAAAAAAGGGGCAAAIPRMSSSSLQQAMLELGFSDFLGGKGKGKRKASGRSGPSGGPENKRMREGAGGLEVDENSRQPFPLPPRHDRQLQQEEGGKIVVSSEDAQKEGPAPPPTRIPVQNGVFLAGADASRGSLVGCKDGHRLQAVGGVEAGGSEVFAAGAISSGQHSRVSVASSLGEDKEAGAVQHQEQQQRDWALDGDAVRRDQPADECALQQPQRHGLPPQDRWSEDMLAEERTLRQANAVRSGSCDPKAGLGGAVPATLAAAEVAPAAAEVQPRQSVAPMQPEALAVDRAAEYVKGGAEQRSDLCVSLKENATCGQVGLSEGVSPLASRASPTPDNSPAVLHSSSHSPAAAASAAAATWEAAEGALSSTAAAAEAWDAQLLGSLLHGDAPAQSCNNLVRVPTSAASKLPRARRDGKAGKESSESRGSGGPRKTPSKAAASAVSSPAAARAATDASAGSVAIAGKHKTADTTKQTKQTKQAKKIKQTKQTKHTWKKGEESSKSKCEDSSSVDDIFAQLFSG